MYKIKVYTHKSGDMKKIEQKKSHYEALSIAKYLLSLDPEREYFNNKRTKNKITSRAITLGNFRLNQILYLLQVFYYLENKEKLFEDNLYAWENGVIVYSVHTHFWSLYFNKDGKIEDKTIKKFIENQFKLLKNVPDRKLQELAYYDPAWSTTWTKSSQPEVNFMDKENMKVYQQFRSRWFQQEVRL